MSSGEVVRDRDDEIPLSEPRWIVIISFTEGRFEEQSYWFTKSSWEDVIKRLENVKDNEQAYIIWHGKYNTNLFRVNEHRIAERMKKEFSMYWPERTKK